MHLKELRLKNWKCFRGEQLLQLSPKAYAVVATMRGDAERSNWLGKSSLLQAIAFALYGRHHEATEDSWVTRGEKSGEVVLVFDDGTRVTRSRHLGKATKLFVSRDKRDLMGDEAQSCLLEAVGLSEQDFVATCYFEQKKMAHLVTMKASDRMDVVSEWLRLSPLERCEALVRERAAKMLDREHELRVQLEAQAAVRAQALGGCADLDVLKKLCDEKTEARAAAKEKANDVAARVRLSLRAKELRQASERFDKMMVDGEELARDVNGRDELALRRELDAAREGLREVDEEKGAASRDVEMRRVVAQGKFDGACPVADIKCPARKEINAKLEESRGALDAAEKRSRELLVRRDVARKRVNEAEAAWQELGRMRERLAYMKAEMQKLIPLRRDYRKSKGEELDEEQLIKMTERADAAMMGAAGEQLEVAQRVRAVEMAEEKLLAARQEVDGIAKELHVVREALVVFGKQGAQRRIAESALSLIEAGANDLLFDCGIPLKLSVRWSREGSGLAKACDACGHPFPTSTKEKACKHCGAPRGAHVVNKLEVALSDRSGAADDLAGGALQLSASAWLRTERVSGWGTALIDEPFGSLDTANRRSFGAHLHGMLSSKYGFVQSLVIAHHPAVLDALPGRIVVESDGKDSAAKVVA